MKHLLLSICLLMFCSSLFNMILVHGWTVTEIVETGATPSQIESFGVNGSLCALDSSGHSLAVRPCQDDVMKDLPAKMRLSFSEGPVLDSETRLSLFLESEVDAPNTEIHIILPDGFSLSCGNLEWNGNLSKGDPVRIDVSVKAEIVGNWRIVAVATSRPANDNPEACSTVCCVRVTEKGGYVLDPSSEDLAQVAAVEFDNRKTMEHIGQSISDNVTVHGYWMYENRSGSSRPTRYAMVELWASKQPSDVLLARAYVQSDGYYVFPPVLNNDSSSGGRYNLYVKLFCESYPYEIVEVGVVGGNSPIWSQTDIHYNVTGEYYDMGTWTVTGENRECWAAYDSVIDGYFWLLKKVNWSRGTVQIFTQGAMSASYGDQIVLYPGDGWNRYTVLHEYGHCVMYTVRGKSFPPTRITANEHYPDTQSDGGWAISEGWAEFFGCAVNNSTTLEGGSYGSIETTVYADNPFGHGDKGDWDGKIVEGAVAQVFWDILDGVSPSDYPPWDEAYGDYISDEFDHLWYVFQTYKPNNIQYFWDHWTPKDPSIWAIFHHARMLEPRNVAVKYVVPSCEGVAVGQKQGINVTVENQGSTIETFNLTVCMDDLVIGQLDNVTLGSGSLETFELIRDTTGMTKGDHIASARITLFPQDSNVTDNVKNGVFTLVSPGHDVGLNNLVISEAVNGPGYVVTTRIDARNIGSYPEVFNVTFTANLTIIGTFPNISLVIADSTTLMMEWNTTAIQKGNYTIAVYASTTSDDMDTTDNTAQSYIFITIPGDINGDFDVNLSDLLLLAQAYSSTSDNARWNSNADIDCNGIVSLADLVIMATHYGQHYP